MMQKEDINKFIQKSEGYIQRQKEYNVIQFIIKTFTDLKWHINDPIECEDLRCKPDLRLDMDDRIIFIEIDENQHKAYDQNKEIDRLLNIHNEIYFKNVFFIRFNPDAFIADNKRYGSCWKKGKDSKIYLYDEYQWNFRLNVLKSTVENCIKYNSDIPFEIIYLFYNKDNNQIKQVKNSILKCKEPDYHYDLFVEDIIRDNKDMLNKYTRIEDNDISVLKKGYLICAVNKSEYIINKGVIVNIIQECDEYYIEYKGRFGRIIKLKTNENIIFYREKTICDENKEKWLNDRSPLEKLKSLKRRVVFMRKQLESVRDLGCD